jgi:BASS family bile acid:Na+ symporter
VDTVRLNFSPESLGVLNAVLALIMFGIALDLDGRAFQRVGRAPRAVVAGLAGVFVLFPAATFLMIRVLEPPPSVALGMLLVASCPGGNMSNFLTHLARGNTALSITLTALSTMAALVATPAGFALWASLDPRTAPLLRAFELDAGAILRTFVLIVVLPLVAGRVVAARAPRLAARLSRPMRLLSIGCFAAFVVAALRLNWPFFTRYVGQVAGWVALQDTAALGLGYALAAVLRLPEPDRRAVALECGIRNSGLALVLVFAFFGGLGGMAITAAWWGVWHVVSGLAIAGWWSRRPVAMPPGAPATAGA